MPVVHLGKLAGASFRFVAVMVMGQSSLIGAVLDRAIASVLRNSVGVSGDSHCFGVPKQWHAQTTLFCHCAIYCCASAMAQKKPTWGNTFEVFPHVGLLVNEPPGTAEMSFT